MRRKSPLVEWVEIIEGVVVMVLLAALPASRALQRYVAAGRLRRQRPGWRAEALVLPNRDDDPWNDSYTRALTWTMHRSIAKGSRANAGAEPVRRPASDANDAGSAMAVTSSCTECARARCRCGGASGA
jgi:hypothetical protein